MQRIRFETNLRFDNLLRALNVMWTKIEKLELWGYHPLSGSFLRVSTSPDLPEERKWSIRREQGRKFTTVVLLLSEMDGTLNTMVFAPIASYI